LALTAQERPITTVEGLSQGGQLHLMQQAFIDQDAFQCGYCTPGQIVSAIACVKEGHAANDDDIREYMSGNICLSEHRRRGQTGRRGGREPPGSRRCIAA
jgi:xanthine dehydrogenase YagT iron-sulfur-binding subunit